MSCRLTHCVAWFLGLSLTTPLPPGFSQDERDGQEPRSASRVLQEIRSQRKALSDQADFLAKQKTAIESRLTRLKELETGQRRLVDLERRMEVAGKNGLPARQNQLEVEFERLETEQEQRWMALEVVTAIQEVRRKQHDLQSAGHPELAGELDSVLTRLRGQSQLVVRYFAAHREDDEAAIEELEQQIEISGRTIELQRESVELRHELLDANQREDREAIDELKSELREIVSRLKKIMGRNEPLEISSSEQRSGRDSLRLPVRIDDVVLAAVAKLDLDRDVVPLLRRFCCDCHDRESTSGDLDLEALLSDRPLVRNRRIWINVLEQIRNRSMPPQEAARLPDNRQRQTMAGWLHRAIFQFDYSQVSQPGFEPMRRLTHHEYNNTVRDLFGVDLRPADRFPVDLSASSGFDNSSNSLFLQPLLMERYLGAAESTVAQALPEQPVTEEQRATRRRIFFSTDVKTEIERAEILLRAFVTRAWRRPVEDTEIAELITVFRAARRDGAMFEAAIRESIRVVLISPAFLLRVEQNHNTTEAWQTSGWELASRLSYFLWASMPDARLFELAQSGRLKQRDVLLGQVDRMLASSKSDTLGTLFAAQWLGFQHLGSRVRADPIDNPWCTDSLMDAMKSESAMFFLSLLREDQPVPRLLDARYTFLNEELARFYGIRGVSGKQMRRVQLHPDSPRGGIFGHGSLLAVTSFPGRTSPVVRGRWILADLLGTPPPPPPPNVSEFEEEIAEAGNLTRRQKLESHRRSPNCYACHSQMDPLGFALENFDWFGRWKQTHRGKPIDARGQLPDGRTFEGATGLKKILIETRLDDLTTQLTRKMLTYALGRQLEYYDEATVQKIVQRMKNSDYRMQTLVQEIVLSQPFQFKQHPSRIPLKNVNIKAAETKAVLP